VTYKEREGNRVADLCALGFEKAGQGTKTIETNFFPKNKDACCVEAPKCSRKIEGEERRAKKKR